MAVDGKKEKERDEVHRAIWAIAVKPALFEHEGEHHGAEHVGREPGRQSEDGASVVHEHFHAGLHIQAVLSTPFLKIF